MKKLLGISLVAVLAVSPLMAGADTTAAATTIGANSTEAGLAQNGTNVVVAGKGAYYAGKSITDADRAATASAAYVKGAYNDAISAVNKVHENITTGLAGKQAALTTGDGINITGNQISVKFAGNSGLEAGTDGSLSVNIDNGTIIKDEVGTLKVGDITVGNVASGSLAGGSAQGALNDKLTTKDYVDEKVSGAITTATSGYGDIVTHNVSEFATSAQGAKADTAVQSVTTGDAQSGNGTIKVDGNAVSVYGLGSAAYTNSSAYDAAGAAAAAQTAAEATAAADATSKANAAQAAAEATAAADATSKANAAEQNAKDYADTAITNLNIGNYATKAGVLATVEAATVTATVPSQSVSGTVPMMIEWGATTADSATVSGSTAGGSITNGEVVAPATYQQGA